MKLKPTNVTIYCMYIHKHIILDENCKKLTQFIDFLGIREEKNQHPVLPYKIVNNKKICRNTLSAS